MEDQGQEPKVQQEDQEGGKQVKVKLLVNVKHNKQRYKAGDTIKVSKAEAEALKAAKAIE